MSDFRGQRRRSRTPRLVDSVQPKRRGRNVIKWLLILFVVGALGGAGVVLGAFVYYGSDAELPRITKVADYRPKVVTKVVDRDGELLGEIYEERRTVVPREKIPEVMIHAIVDAEDAQFYEHNGLNYVGMLRAFLNNLRPGAHLQGGSTITQQLVKTYLLKTNERTVRRKVQEVILARRLESALSKDEILYIYLNQIFFGHQRYGVEEAARFFFGKSIADVNAGEAALLASLPKGPEEISPLKHPERAKDRQRYVLSQMLRYGHATKAEVERYGNAPIELVRPPSTSGSAPEFVDEAKKALLEKFGEDKIPYLGATVRTTCDSRIQKLSREALEHQLESLDERQGYRKPLSHLKTTTPPEIKRVLQERALHRLHSVIETPTRAQRQKWLDDRDHALSSGKVVEAVVTELRQGTGTGTSGAQGLIVDAAVERAFMPVAAVAASVSDPEPEKKVKGEKNEKAEGPEGRAQKHEGGKHERYNPKGLPLDKRFSVGDVIAVRVEPSLGKTDDDLPIAVPEFGPQGAVLVIDPATRDVKAVVGGYGFRAGGFDRALHAKRQPGSSFKPFLYATAFLSGKYTPASVLNDSPQIYEQPGLKDWKPKNAESHEFLGPVRLRVALAKSLNTVASQLIFDLHPEPVAETARNAGIESKLEENLSLGLGSSVVSLLELTNAYATFDAQGQKAPPVLIDSLSDVPGVAPGTTRLPRVDPKQALQPEIAYLVTSMLESVIEEGTAVAAKGKLKRPAAGKTGTTSSERDAWFIGYTPDLVVGVWVGFDDMRDLGHGEQGARSSLPVWIDVMNGALKGVPPRPFPQPPGIEVQRIDPTTGLLAAPGAANAVDEYFLAGSAPTQQAPQAGEQNPDTFIIDQAQ